MRLLKRSAGLANLIFTWSHRRLEPAVNRLVMGMVVSALFLGSSIAH